MKRNIIATAKLYLRKNMLINLDKVKDNSEAAFIGKGKVCGQIN